MHEIMATTNQLHLTPPAIILLSVLAVWELAWKGVALWKASKNRQLAWFVAILILNTAGILEIIYIFFFQRKGPGAGKP